MGRMAWTCLRAVNPSRPALSSDKDSMQVNVLKRNERTTTPKVSLILLDWSCRESLHALDWLAKQDVPRDQYELMWVELYDRVPQEVMDKADVVITCGQEGMYHKHEGYNAGLLHSRGQIITVCDSDAVFPPDFVASILRSFKLDGSGEPVPLVLMHYEQRSQSEYPNGMSDIRELRNFAWFPLWPNVGACMSIRRSDAIRFGGFDEHESYRGYLCGPYDLGWRLVNAGIPEVWHDESVTLWHFAHPNPVGAFCQPFKRKMWREVTYPHIKHHALMAVEAFSTGRMHPLQENPEIHKLRMSLRRIGTKFEEEYAWMTGVRGFTPWQRFKLHLMLPFEPLKPLYWRARSFTTMQLLKILKVVVGPEIYDKIKAWWHSVRDKKAAPNTES
ncbi:MAG: glycosyltransferase [Planctomycetes bacterium]|nr:glycosyltransferase [Planctomycetota bacterium]